MSKKSRERHALRTEYFEALRETAEAVDPYVKQFFEGRFEIVPALKSHIISIYRFGKPQLRPAQVRFAYELVGGEDWKKAIPACAAVEMKDTAYYCVDDFLDMRAEPSKILSALTLYSLSYAMVGDLFSYHPAEKVRAVLEELSKLDEENAQGVILDSRLNEPNEELYMKKVKLYNFWERALRIGAVLGGASQQTINQLGFAGQRIGMAYIIANDTWDFGKDLEDFRAGKYTLPILYAFENAKEERGELESLFGHKALTPEEISRTRDIMTRSGAIAHGRNKAQELCKEGVEILSHFPDSKPRRLLEFATTMTQRNKYYDVLMAGRI